MFTKYTPDLKLAKYTFISKKMVKYVKQNYKNI